MENLKKFGVLGGYDFSNDEGSVKEYITRTMRREGLTPDNAMSAEKLFFKLWDGLGELTTRSDGATRQAVYDGVYKKLIKGQSKADALKNTQQEFLNHPIPGLRHPYYWAAFQLSGDWKSLNE